MCSSLTSGQIDFYQSLISGGYPKPVAIQQHVYDDIDRHWIDIVLDIGLDRHDLEFMSYDVYYDMRAGPYDPEFMS